MIGELLRVREVAERLSMTPKTVYLLAESGRLAHFIIRSAVRVYEDQLQAFLNENQRPVRTPVQFQR